MPDPSRQIQLRHGLLVILAVIAVSFSAILIKLSTAPAAVIGMYRLLFAAVLLLPVFLRLRHQLRSLSRRDWLLVMLSGVFLGLHFLFWIESLKLTSVASSMIVLSLQPVFVMVGAFALFSERTHMAAVISMLIAISGSIVIAIGDSSNVTGSLVGDTMSLLGTLAVSGYMLSGQHLRTSVSSTVYNFLVFAAATVVLVLFNIGARNPVFGYSSRNWFLFVLLAIVPTLFGHALFNWLLRYVSATFLSMSILGEPIGAIVLAVILLHESLHTFQVIGGAFTLFGVWLFLWTHRKQKSATPQTLSTQTTVNSAKKQG